MAKKPWRGAKTARRLALLAACWLALVRYGAAQDGSITSAAWNNVLTSPEQLAQWFAESGFYFDSSLQIVLGPHGNLTAMAAAQSFSDWTKAAGLGLSTTALAATKSFDGDTANLMRYAMNLDETGRDTLLPQVTLVSTDAGPALAIAYRQRKGMVDVVLVPQYSTDLTTWTNVPAPNIVQLADDDANTARYSATMLLPSGQPLYLRVTAQPNNTPITPWPVTAGGNGHYYQVIFGWWGTVSVSFAENYAAARGGYVATITSAEENAFVYNLANAPQFWQEEPAGTGLAGPLLGIAPAGGTSTSLAGLQWLNNEGGLVYANWDPAFTIGRNQFSGITFFSSAGAPAPTWTAYAGGSGTTSFVIEYNSNPAGN